jgi:hypothetical protein
MNGSLRDKKNGGGPNMTIELIAYPVLAFLAVTLATKLIERRNDVLYGPYIQGRKRMSTDMRDRFGAAMAAIGLRRDFGRLALTLAPVSIFASAIIG